MEQPSKSRENLVAGNLFGANDKNFTLYLCLSGTAQPVSAVSSILRINSPPLLLICAQFIAADLALPMCIKPVGLGANLDFKNT